MRKSKIDRRYLPWQVADKLCEITGTKEHKANEEMEEALYQIMLMAESGYNRACYTRIWNALQDLTAQNNISKGGS